MLELNISSSEVMSVLRPWEMGDLLPLDFILVFALSLFPFNDFTFRSIVLLSWKILQFICCFSGELSLSFPSSTKMFRPLTSLGHSYFVSSKTSLSSQSLVINACYLFVMSIFFNKTKAIFLRSSFWISPFCLKSRLTRSSFA